MSDTSPVSPVSPPPSPRFSPSSNAPPSPSSNAPFSPSSGYSGSGPDSSGLSEPVTVVAHRGASGYAPENTAAAIEEAIAQGAHFVEVDVRLTADGEAVLLHDATLTRTTDVAEVFPDREPWRVGDFTLAELGRLDAGSWFDSAYAGERVLTLRTALEVMRDRIGLWLELKSPRQHPGLEKVVADVLRSAPGGWLTEPGRCVATCFDREALGRFAGEVGDAVPFGQLGSRVPSDAELAELARWVGYYIPDCRAVEAGDLVRIRAAGLRAALWTPNDPVTVASLVAQGASALIGNYPAVTARVLEAGRYEVPGAPLAVERLITGQQTEWEGVVGQGPGDGPGRGAAPGSPERGVAGPTCSAVLRNLSRDPVPTGGWYLRGDAADRLWCGSEADGVLEPGGELRARLARRTDTAALHAPDGTVVGVVALPPTPPARPDQDRL